MFFFFQAEDGIRDADVTGVQTCALPILGTLAQAPFRPVSRQAQGNVVRIQRRDARGHGKHANEQELGQVDVLEQKVRQPLRSEERRVGKECRSRWSLSREKKKSIE